MGFSSSSVLSVYCRTWWHLSSRKLVGVPVGFASSSPLLGGVLFDLVPILSWVFSPGFGRGFSLSRVVRHRSGFLLLSSSSGLVAAFASPLWLRAPSFSGGGGAVISLHPVSSRSAGHFGSDRLVSPLPHYCWSRVHGRASAGLLVESQRWGYCSWFYRASRLVGGLPLLRLLPFF